MKTLTAKEYEKFLLPDQSVRSSQLYRRLRSEVEAGRLQRAGKGLYYITAGSPHPCYSCTSSEPMRLILMHIRRNVPRIPLQVWEMKQLNEFLRFPVRENIYFLETGKESEIPLFQYLRSHYDHVLLNPSPSDFALYHGNEKTIVIQKKLSETPKAIDASGSCALEKILADLYSRSLIGKILNQEICDEILAGAYHKYLINEKKMLRYARRRNAEGILLEAKKRIQEL